MHFCFVPDNIYLNLPVFFCRLPEVVPYRGPVEGMVGVVEVVDKRVLD